MIDIRPDSRVGEIAAHYPLATRVLARHRIDFCCGGGVPLEKACAARGVSPEQVVAEMHAELAGAPAEPSRWLEAPLPELVEHIVTTFHRPLREELPRLELMARKVARVHADRDPEGRLPALVDTFVALRGELEEHMEEEEESLFPALLDRRSDVGVAAFVDDHTVAGAALERLRELTDGYVAPADACNTWRALWAGLAALESTMHEHVHLENNVLVPRAAAAA